MGLFFPYIEESFSLFSAGGERNPQRVGERGLCVALFAAAGGQYHGEEQPDDGGIDGGGHGAGGNGAGACGTARSVVIGYAYHRAACGEEEGPQHPPEDVFHLHRLPFFSLVVVYTIFSPASVIKVT